MSTTMPSASSSARRNSTSTTYVAPCSRWAGPNTSPRRLCAIMMWSRTVTLYITDPVAESVAAGEHGHDLRQRVERALAADQRVERGIGQQRQRERHPAPAIPSRAVRRRDMSDLRRRQRQAARVERFAEAQRNGTISIPAQLHDVRLEPGEPQRQLQARLARARVEDDIAIASGGSGKCEPDAERASHRRPRRVDVD